MNSPHTRFSASAMAAALCLSLTIAAQGNRPGLDSILGQLSKAQYVAVLQAMNSGLLDSAFSLSSAIYAKARQSNDSEYIVKSTIVMGNIASHRQDYPASRNFYHIAGQYASNEADRLRIAGNQSLVTYMEGKYGIAAQSFKGLARQAGQDSLPGIACKVSIDTLQFFFS